MTGDDFARDYAAEVDHRVGLCCVPQCQRPAAVRIINDALMCRYHFDRRDHREEQAYREQQAIERYEHSQRCQWDDKFTPY